MRQIATGRMIGLVIALAATGVTIRFGIDAYRLHTRFYDWVEARPMETTLDLSQPGAKTVPFQQTCSISHGEGLYVDWRFIEETTLDVRDQFAGLKGTCTIKDSDGQEVETVPFHTESVQYWGGETLLAELSTFPEGHYTATIQINSGAPAFANQEQTLYARYQLCGLEKIMAFVAGAISFASLAVAAFAAGCIAKGLQRNGIWRTTENTDAKEESAPLAEDTPNP